MTPWTVAFEAPLTMEFSRQEEWSGLPFPPEGDLPDPGIKPPFLRSLALAYLFILYHWHHLGRPIFGVICCYLCLYFSMSQYFELFFSFLLYLHIQSEIGGKTLDEFIAFLNFIFSTCIFFFFDRYHTYCCG